MKDSKICHTQIYLFDIRIISWQFRSRRNSKNRSCPCVRGIYLRKEVCPRRRAGSRDNIFSQRELCAQLDNFCFPMVECQARDQEVISLFPIRTHTQVGGSILGRVLTEGSQPMFLSHQHFYLPTMFPSFLKSIKSYFK